MTRWSGVLVLLALVACNADNRGNDSASPAPPESPPPASGSEVETRPLHFSMDEANACLRLMDDAGRTVLQTVCETGAEVTGTLGFQTTLGGGLRRYRELGPLKLNPTPLDPSALGWFHATRVMSAQRTPNRYQAQLATNDPQGRTLTLALERNQNGVVSLALSINGATADVEALGVAFAAETSEGFFGAGRRDVGPDLRGQVIENYVGEGPYQFEEYPVIRAIIPPWSIRQRPEDSYYPIPWVLSSRGIGVSIENDETSYFRFATERSDAWSLEVEATELRLRFFAGTTPAGALAGYSAHYGRQPAPGAPYFFGPWFQTGQPDQPPLAEERGYIELLQNADAPVSVAETHMHYLPCDAWVGRRDGERARVAMFNGKGLPTLAYLNPILCTRYAERWNAAVAAGVLQKNGLGQPYIYSGFEGGGAFPPLALQAQVDFTHPDAETFYAEAIDLILEDGHVGWMEDFGENTPLDARAFDGTSGEALHNRYPVDYHCAIDRIVRRKHAQTGIPLVRFARAGWRGMAPCVPIVWGGDPTVAWGYDGLETQITNGLSMGLSGIAMWGSDIGGYFATFSRTLTPELLTRWIQFGAVSAVMRTKGSGQEYGASTFIDRKQIWEQDMVGQWRRWAALHTQLYPYLAAAHAHYRETGVPIMRHHLLTHPADADARRHGDQYLFGPDLLAAPVYAEGATSRSVYLPRGDHWIVAWDALHYNEVTTGLTLGTAAPLEGGRTLKLDAPLEELPLLIRAGAVLPLLSPEVRTLADTAAAPGVVKLIDRQNELHLLAFPRDHSRARFYENEYFLSEEQPGGWRLAIEGLATRRYTLQASFATLTQPFTPCSVSLNGERLTDWRYDAGTRVLRVSFAASQAVLEASACP